MSHEKHDDNPFSFKHFIKNKKESLTDNRETSRFGSNNDDEPNVYNQSPFPEVNGIGKKKDKGKTLVSYL